MSKIKMLMITHLCLAVHLQVGLNVGYNIPIVPKKITIGTLVSIAKEPFMESDNSNRIMKL